MKSYIFKSFNQQKTFVIFKVSNYSLRYDNFISHVTYLAFLCIRFFTNLVIFYIHRDKTFDIAVIH